MNNYVFDGRSRSTRMQFARDVRPSRDQLLEDAHKRRQQREEAARRARAATRIQQAVRILLSRQRALGIIVDDVFAPLSNTQAVQGGTQRLGHLCWCFRYLQRHHAIMPRWLQEKYNSNNNNNNNSSSGGGGVVRRCASQLAAVVRQALQQQRSSGALAPHALPQGAAAPFIAEVLLEDYATSAVDGSAVEAAGALHTLTELLQLVADDAAAAAAGPSGRAAATLGWVAASFLNYAASWTAAAPEPRRRLAEVLEPLLQRYAALVLAPAHRQPPSPSPGVVAGGGQNEEGEGAAACGTAADAAFVAFGDACWAALSSPGGGRLDSYLTLTPRPAAVLLSTPTSAPATDGSSSTEAAQLDVVLLVVAVAHERVVRHAFMDAPRPASPTARGERWWAQTAMTVLGKLTRLLPFFLDGGAVEGAGGDAAVAVGWRLARAAWLECVGALSERLCQADVFTREVLHDLQHAGSISNTISNSNDAAAAAHTSEQLQQQHRQEEEEEEEGRRLRAERGGRYRSLASHLFSSEGGLRLMQQLAGGSDDSHCHNNHHHHGEGEDEEGEGEGCSAATARYHCVLPPALAARLLSLSPLEAVSGLFAWPLYSFSLAGTQQRLKTAAVFAKLVRTPQLLRQLWRLYRARCPGLAALTADAALLDRLCAIAAQPGTAVRVPCWAAPPSAVLEAHGVRGRQGMFWDPQPALAALFFTLFGYYVEVTDFGRGLEEGTVLTQRECWALVLALKEIVHRSHLHGVVPHANCEAVAHLAVTLLGKLHVLNESATFVPFPSMWISTNDPATMRALGNITPEEWGEQSRRVQRERRALVRKLDGSASDEADDSSDGAENGHSPQPEGGQEWAGAGASVLQQQQPVVVRARCPGGDLTFTDSTTWTLTERVVRVLLRAPFMIPFGERAALLTMLLLSQQPQRMPGRPTFFVAHRGRTFVDAFDIFGEKPDDPSMYHVRFAAAAAAGGGGGGRGGRRRRILNGSDDDDEDEEGLEEGYGQGVYREFAVSVCREGFGVEHGLFRQTDDGFVFPNPFSFEATGDAQHLAKIRFLGAMVGRAFRDGILQEYPFALHFRNALLNRRNAISHLRHFDGELYGQLVSLAGMAADDLEALGLTFTYTVNALGITREVELIEGGGAVPVTKNNCYHYIQLVADFKLNREGAQQTRAFKTGLESIIQASWLQLFDSNELLSLLSGDQSGRIDVDDWRRHTTYNPPEAKDTPPVRIFWQVVESLSREQQSKLLKFSTSMNRPPLLGFRFLSPPFNIQLLSREAVDRLPTASTCFSMLKLPPYLDAATARAKIVAAIEETESFGLT